MTTRTLGAVAVVVSLSFAAFAVYVWTHLVDRKASDRYAEQLKALATLDARLVEEAMKARAGLVAHYDGIARAEAALKRTHDRLSTTPEFLPDAARAEVEAAVTSSVSGHGEAQRLIERFKSEHAILRNSLHFIPVAAAEVAAYVPTSEEEAEFKLTVNALVRDLLQLQVWGGPRTQSRIERSLENLAKYQAIGPWTDVDLALMRKHAVIVKEKSPVVDELARAIADAPIQERSQELTSTYGRHYRSALDRSNREESILFGLALLMVATAAAFVIARLRRSARELERSGQELAKVVETLEVEKEKQKELAELKSRFVSMTSHQFRTPLSVIVSSSEMLSAYAESLSDEKKEGHLRGIRAAALGMTRMLDRILLIGRSDAGMLELNPGPMDLEEFCSQLVESTEQSMDTAGIVVRTGPEPETIVADGELLHHILENLLSNAIKYSARDTKVRLDVWRDGDDVVFQVADRGIGIPAEDQEQLFETFYRASNVGKVRGTGLGLSIVKRAVDLHQGSLDVQSKVGEGTTFTVRVPCPREAA